jgi:hypothetical protein
VREEHQCKNKNMPLVSGGWLDQPVKRTFLNEQAYIIYQAFHMHANRQMTETDFSKNHPDAWDIITRFEKEILTQ